MCIVAVAVIYNNKMAFMGHVAAERFSLLLLESREIYFEDFSVQCYTALNIDREPKSLREIDSNKISGRLKICSKSVVFDPRDVKYPILKFPLKDCKRLEKWTASLFTRSDISYGILLECDQVIEMLENNVIAAYKFKQGLMRYLFVFNFASIDDCLSQICQLQRASTLPVAEQDSMIAAIVLSRQARTSFDVCWLEDFRENVILETTGNRISPLVINPGRIVLTGSRLYFQPYNNAEQFPVLKINLTDIKQIVKRRFLLRHIGIEIYCGNHLSPISHLFISLKSRAERDNLYDNILQLDVTRLEDNEKENMILLWQNGVISNYDYLLYLNSVADRSFNDLTQYPVFPWIISDYTSDSLELDDENVFRDLSKPIGALNAERLRKLKERYAEMPEPKFLYGSHYSTPGFVLYYLVRKDPQYMLCLQNGRFDHPDRMFSSIPDTWRNVTSNGTDFKELIPEFFQPEHKGDLLINSKNLDFGLRQDGSIVGNVELPKWATDAADFVQKLRLALESEYVSRELNNWIDLIFGYKQNGVAAENSDNVFYYLTYEGAADLDSITDLNERYSMEVQIMEFGQVPKQIFTAPHPRKCPLSISRADGKLFLDRNPSDLVELYTKKSAGENCKYSTTGEKTYWLELENMERSWSQQLHKDEVTSVCLSANGSTLCSVSKDAMMKMCVVEEKKQLRSINLCNMALSSCKLMPDDRTAVIGAWDNNVYMYNMEYGKVLETTFAHDDAVSAIDWNRDLLATASWDSTAKLWKYIPHRNLKPQTSASLLAELDHDTRLHSICLSENNALVVTGTDDGTVQIWDVSTGENIGKYKSHSCRVNAVSFSPDMQRIISCGDDVKVLDVRTGTKVFSKDVGEELRCICWDGKMAITGGSSGNLFLWDLVKAQLIKTITAHKGIEIEDLFQQLVGLQYESRVDNFQERPLVSAQLVMGNYSRPEERIAL